jgi:N-acetylglucosaminyldiphosphoundecaprenol N-acetyl-beta-D-mannosaminyltransferase
VLVKHEAQSTYHMINEGKHNILGVLVSAVDYEATVAAVVDAAAAHRGIAVSAMAVHGVMTGYLDSQHRHRLNNFDLVVPDGQPVKWALRWLAGTRLPDRVYGPKLMLNICSEASRLGLPIFLYGSTDQALVKLSANLLRKFPDLKIAGTRSSRFRRLSPNEKKELVSHINDSGARIVFVALGCPRQEVWAYEFREALRLPIIAVGGAFTVHAGLASQAPKWMQQRGLEWTFRLASEPARLWRRYLLLNPLFLISFTLQMLGLRFDTSGQEPQGELLYG